MNSTHSHEESVDGRRLADTVIRTGTGEQADLVAYVMEDQRQSWRDGNRRMVEYYLQEHSRLLDDTDGLLDVIYNEICLRTDLREPVTPSEYRQRFPQYESEIEPLFKVHEAISEIGSDFSIEPQEPVDWTGRRIAQYRIKSLLGTGGMGQVFLAQDLALDRRVALKLLPDYFTPTVRERFLKEAEESARLQHPAIATFFETGESEGLSYIAMEFVEGRTLRNIIQEGPVSKEQTVSILTRVVEALGHAHSWDLVHRDVKPENIMVTGEDQAKLLDFGIAHRLGVLKAAKRPSTDDEREAPLNSLVGTPGYMSPEQIKNEPPDGRSDLFAVGTIMFEMLSGKPAFPGKTIMDRIHATLDGDLSRQLEETPAEFRAIIGRCLALAPTDRYSSTSDLLNDIRQLDSRSRGLDAQTIAILPFDADADVPSWVPFAMTEGIGNDLTRVTQIRVLPVIRVAAVLNSLPSEDPTPYDIGKALAVDLILFGTAHRLREAINFHVQLIDVRTGEVVAIDQISGSLEAAPEIQQKLTAFVHAQLAESTLPELIPTPSRAYEYYARGRQLWMSTEKADLQRAAEMFEKCIEVNPSHAPALSGLASARALRYAFTTERDDLSAAESLARRALDSDPQDSNAHTWLGYVLGHQGESVASYRQQMKAIECDPFNFMGYYFAVFPFVECNNSSEAMELHRQLSESTTCDPHIWRRREAVQLIRRALAINPRHGWSWLALGNLLTALGDLPSAVSAVEKAVKLEDITKLNNTAGAEGYLGECQRRIGNLVRARLHCEKGLKALEKTDNIYRDTFRGVFLCSLGRTAVADRNPQAARAAFLQATQHLEGRKRARAGGHPLVQALAGLAAVEQDASRFDEALSLFRDRHDFDFSFMWCCTNDMTLLDLSHCAAELGQKDMAQSLFDEAIDAGFLDDSSGQSTTVKGARPPR